MSGLKPSVFVSTQRVVVAAAAALGLLAALTASAGCGHAARPATGPVVKVLRFEGNDALGDGTLREKIITEKTSWLPFSEKKRLDPVLWEGDLERLRRAYHAAGYHAAEVTATLERPVADEVEITVHVKEGPRSHVGKLAIEGLGGLSEDVRRAVTRKLPLSVGAPFTEDAWEATKGAIVSRLKERSHERADLEGRALVALDAARVDATIDVTPGPSYRTGPIVVEQGRPPHVPAHLIEEQVRLAFPEGALYLPEDFRTAQRRVFAMGVFSTAEVVPGKPTNGVLPVVVRTQTAPFRSVNVGGGARADQVRSEVRLRGGWTHTNFLGGLRKLSLDARLGWAFLPGIFAFLEDRDTEMRHGPIYNVAATFEQPRLLGGPAWRLLLGASSDRQLEEAYTSIAGRAGPGVVWRPGAKLTMHVGYEAYGARLGAVDDIDPRDAPLVLGCNDNPCTILLSYLRQRFAWDDRDDVLAPTQGLYSSLELIEGGGPLGGSFTYFRALAEGRAYETWGRLTLGGRVQVGGLFPRSGRPDDTPIEHRFFAGGATSMRGFGSIRLSPMVGVNNDGEEVTRENADGTLAIGGGGLFVSNLELRVRTTRSLSVAGFWDTGLVTPEPLDAFAFGDLFHAFGVGLRFATPVGPIRLDVAARLPTGGPRTVLINRTEEPFAESTSCFGFGGSSEATPLDDGLCALHLSIGEAF